MLKRIALTAVLAAGLSVASFIDMAQGLDMSGRVRTAYFSSETDDKANDAKSSSSGITTDALIGFSHSEDILDGWTASAAFDFFNKPSTDDGVVADGNYNISLGNDSFTVVAGHTKYLGSVASMGGWETDKTSADYDFSLADKGDLAGRGENIGISITAVPELTFKLGFGMSSEEEGGKEKTASSNGLLVAYSAVAGLDMGVSIANSESEDKIAGTDKKSETSTAIGVSYNLSDSADLPLNVWAGTWMKEVKEGDEKTSDGFSSVGLGADYDYGAGNVGLSYDMATFEKGTNDKEHEGTLMVLWANYNIADGTKAFFTYSSSEVGGDDKKTDGGLTLGLRQNF